MDIEYIHFTDNVQYVLLVSTITARNYTKQHLCRAS
jgi:hypothetical protein